MKKVVDRLESGPMEESPSSSPRKKTLKGLRHEIC